MSEGGDRLTRLAVERALATGAEEAEAWLERTVTRRIRVYEGQVESLSDAGGRGIGVRALLGGRVGYACTTDLSEEGLRAVARAATEAARVADPDPFAGLPAVAQPRRLDGLSASATGRWTIEDKVALGLEVERVARARPGVSQVEAVVYADTESEVSIANSRGLAAGYETTSATAWASAFAGEGTELMTGLGVGFARGPDELDPVAIGTEAAERALALRGARQPPSRRCAVVLDPFVAAAFIGFIGQMLSAEAVQRGGSLFAGRLGESVAGTSFALVDDGAAGGGPASAPFDGEGTPTVKTDLIAGGRVRALLHDCRTAREEGGESTGNARRGSYRSAPSVGTTNLVLEPGEATLETLLGSAGDGLYVTDVAGLHSGVDPVSGTFSVGASGMAIENGELGAPVREVTIASDLISMLGSVEAVGEQSRWIPTAGAVRASPLLMGEMSVSGS